MKPLTHPLDISTVKWESSGVLSACAVGLHRDAQAILEYNWWPEDVIGRTKGTNAKLER